MPSQRANPDGSSLKMFQGFLAGLSRDESEPSFEPMDVNILSGKPPHAHPSLDQRPVIDLKAMYDGVSLASKEFRVLQLEPAHSPEDPIVTHLIKARVDSPPMYDALSYRWEGGDSQTVSVNGAELKVTDNLYAALRSLRREANPLPRVLWVDSICINQSSGPERAEQVPLMGDIYTQAHAVRIWLGEEGPGVEEALRLVRDCGTETPAEVVGRVLGDEDGARGLVELLRRCYWGRMWMFQEVVLAANAIVHCGSHEAPWNHFKWLHDVTAERAFWEEFEVGHTWISDLRRALFRISLFSIPRDAAEDVNAVSIPTRQLQATDPRDKVYGLMGVCQELAKTVKVDYAAPVRDVYTDFAKSRIESDGELYTLLTAGLWTPENGEDLGIPSWVPDLRGTADVDTRYMGAAYLGRYNADGNGGSSPFFAFSDRDGYNILEVEALILDSVQVHKKLDNRDEQDRKSLIDSFCRSDDGSGFSASKLRQFFEAMVFGKPVHPSETKEGDRRANESLQRLALGFFEDLQHLYGAQQAFIGFLESFRDVGLELFDKHTSQLSPEFGPDELHRDELEYLYRTSSNGDGGSTMFSTANGCIGIGTHNMEEGDLVAIVRGSRIPLLFREQGDYLRLVGPSYVFNVMQGEAVSGGYQPISQPFGRLHII